MAVRKIRVKVNGYQLVSTALDDAVARAMNKVDKWCDDELTESQRTVLAEQVRNYFWAALDEAGVVIG